MIHICTPNNTFDYKLIDSGNGKRYEQFGPYHLIRPDASCLWPADQLSWNLVDAEFTHAWHFTNKKMPTEWRISLGQHHGYNIFCEVFCTRNKNIGLFPEMIGHWPWLNEQITAFIAQHQRAPRILNLFGHTGSTTLFMAACGAIVTHVDASKPAVKRAKVNQHLSDLDNAPIRWIVDDCIRFVEREIRREKMYDGIIMDPPAFGRDHKKRQFSFSEDINNLLERCSMILSKDYALFILNGYALGNSAQHLYNTVTHHINYPAHMGELHLVDLQSKHLPCSLFVRL